MTLKFGELPEDRREAANKQCMSQLKESPGIWAWFSDPWASGPKVLFTGLRANVIPGIDSTNLEYKLVNDEVWVRYVSPAGEGEMVSEKSESRLREALLTDREIVQSIERAASISNRIRRTLLPSSQVTAQGFRRRLQEVELRQLAEDTNFVRDLQALHSELVRIIEN